MTPIADVAVALPVVLGGMLTTVTVTAGVLLWLGGRFRAVEGSIADAVKQLIAEIHHVANRVTIIETRIEHRGPDPAE